MKTRLQHIDIAKGVGILLVALGHNWIVAADQGELYTIISSFHVPLFFFLSGLFIATERPMGVFAIGRIHALLKPYFVTLLIVCIFYAIFLDYPVKKFLVGMLYGNGSTIVWPPLWFLPHLWIASIFSLFVIQKSRLQTRSIWIQLGFLGALLLIGVATIDLFWELPIMEDGHLMQMFHKDFLLPGLPFSVDIIFISSFYIVLGFVFKAHMTEFAFSNARLIGGVILFGLLHFYFDYTIDAALRIYGHPIISTLEALLGIDIVLGVSILLQNETMIAELLSKIGAATLFILLFHGFIQEKTFLLLSHFGVYNYLNAVVSFVVGVSGSMLIGSMIQKNSLLRNLYLAPRKI